MKIKIIITSISLSFPLYSMESASLAPKPRINYKRASLEMLAIHHVAQQLSYALLQDKIQKLVTSKPLLSLPDIHQDTLLQKASDYLGLRYLSPTLFDKIMLALALHIKISKAERDKKIYFLKQLLSLNYQRQTGEQQGNTSVQEASHSHTFIKSLKSAVDSDSGDTLTLDDHATPHPIQPALALEKNIELIHQATMLKNTQAVDSLLSLDSNVQAKTPIYQDTPYHYAARSGHNQVLHSLIQAEPTTKANGQQVYPLSEAIRSNNQDGAQLLISLPEFYEDQRRVEQALEYLLEYSTNQQIAYMVSQAIKRSPFYDTFDTVYKWCLAIAAHDNALFLFPDSPRYSLARQNKEYSYKDMLTPLCIAAAFNNTEAASFLLSKHANYQVQIPTHLFGEPYLATPLFIAARAGHIEMVKLLLDVDSQLILNGISVLHCAVMSGSQQLVELLLNRHPELLNLSEQKVTPLHVAVHSEHSTLVRLLVERGAAINVTSEHGSTPLRLAFQFNKQPDCVQYLIEHGATLPELNNDTLLCRAATLGWVHIVKLLLAQGLNPQQPNAEGKLPIDIAQEQENTLLFGLLANNQIKK